jgi:hypothetical protein
VILCGDDELGYVATRTGFADGQGLVLDESYRLAHLPLVAPDHPRVIARAPGKPYDMGRRHPPVLSLALPIPGDELTAALRPLEAELKAAPFAHKIAWNILPRRQAKLHATLCTGPVIGEHERRELQRLGGVTVELRGLFSGHINVGRLYIRVYPERRDGMNLFHFIQDLLQRPRTDRYLVGLYNLVDDLDSVEAVALSRLLDRWWSEPVLRLRANALWHLSANDDLVLDANVVEAIPLQ